MEEYNRTNLAFKMDDSTKESPHVIDLPLDTSALSLHEERAGFGAGALEGKNSISDALISCVRDTRRVDIYRIAEAAGVAPKEVIEALRGAIYCNPETWCRDPYQGWELADEYLSGKLRYKLARARVAAKVYKGTFEDNVKALEAILPPEVRAEDIYVTLGSPWLSTEIIDEFVNHLIQPHDYHRFKGTKHDEETGSWEIPYKNVFSGYVRNTSTFGTPRMSALQILEKALNMKTIRITDEEPSMTTKSGKRRVVNREDTAAAQEKQKLIIDEFQRWIWQDERRKHVIKELFEDKFGCNVARRFDGRFLEFPGMSDEVALYSSQKNDIFQGMTSDNMLIAGGVGTGKSYTMIVIAMELQRMGMAKKSMFVVPNNLVEQWRSFFLTLYPEAKLLCIEPKDMVPGRINKTLRKVIDNTYDGIIIAYSCFDRIPLSKEAHMDALKAERDEMLKIKSTKKDVTSSFNRKLERLAKEISRLALSKDSDRDMICFNQLGIDRLFVDEAHNYKNVSINTSIYGVYGINRKGSAKCDSMMEKVHYVQKTHNGGGVIMATATPITNSITDIYVFQKYLQSGELELLGLQTFDSWVGMFAETTTEFEIAVDTGSYRLATRFAKFHNIPELTTILASIASFHDIEEDVDIPEFDGYTDVVIPCSPKLKDYLKSLSERADKVHNGEVKPEEDNMLKITNDAGLMTLDLRHEKELLSQDDTDYLYGEPIGICKVGECSERAGTIYHRTKDEKLTQIIFCDRSTPKSGFNVYDDLKQRLINLDVKEKEIAYVHDATTAKKREKLFRDMREGKIRILIGSTFKLGLGVNVQDRLVAIHHLDLPWRPADMVQREGRILRTGNRNAKVEIYRYITEDSFDAYSWQLLETKQRFITDILSGTIAGRSGSEIDDTVLDYAEVKALALGNPLLKSRVQTRNELSRLSVLHKKSIENRLRLEQRYQELPNAIAAKELELTICASDWEYIEKEGKGTYEGLGHREKVQLAAQRRFLREYLAENLYGYVMRPKDKAMFDYRGFMIVLPANMSADYPYLYLVREGKYRVDMSDKEVGILIRIDNFLDKMDEYVVRVQREKELLEQEFAETEAELAEADSYAERIDEVAAKLSVLDEALGVNDLKNRIR